MYDAVIIGGGPVGSRAAYKLSMAGNTVVVLDKKQQIGGKACCTGIVSQECANSFNVDDKVILRRVNSARLFSPSGRWLSVRREEPQACILDRAAFNMAMADRSRESGAEYMLNCPVRDIEIGEDGVRIFSGERVDFEAKALIVASGFGSKLGERLGLGGGGDFVMGAQAEVETPDADEVEVYFGNEIAPGFFAWLVPVSTQRARVGLLSRRNPGLYLRKFLASLAAGGKIVSSDVELSYGGIPLEPPARTYGERLIVVGDAAGQVKPTTGGGIYYGLLCADIAAGTLRRALQEGDLSDKRLAQYERRWKKKLGWELKVGHWARQLFERLNDRQIDRIFDIVKANGIDEAILKAKDISFDWHSGAVLKLMGHHLVSRALDLVKIPFRTGEN